MKKELMISRIEDFISKSKDKNDLPKAQMYFGCALGFFEACSRMNIIDPAEYISFNEQLMSSEDEKAGTA